MDKTAHSVVYRLRTCLNEDNHSPTNIKRDHLRKIIICAGNGFILCNFDSQFSFVLDGEYYSLDYFSEVTLIRSTFGPATSGLNSELVFKARHSCIKNSCLGQNNE